MEALPVGFAFVAGMVATVNPCGFAMIPSYLAIILATEDPWRGGLRLGGWVTAGFLVVFGAAGVLFNWVSSRIMAAVPWLALVLGVGLILFGIGTLLGRIPYLPSVSMRSLRNDRPSNLVAFGMAYGLASLSCTLPVFLAVVGAAVATGDPLTGTAVFAAYGLGMGVVLTGTAVAVAASKDAVIFRLRNLGRYLTPLGGWVLIGSGLFIVYYWAASLAVAPTVGGSPWLAPIFVVDRISAWLQASIGSHPLRWLAAFGVVGSVAWAVARRVRRRDGEELASVGRRVDEAP